MATASDSWACVATAVRLFVFFYACIVAAEENFLRARFGDAFDRYAHEVSHWGARFRDLSQTLKATRFHWRRLLVKEYGTPFGWINGLCLLGLLKLEQSPALNSMHPHARALFIGILAGAAVLWAAALLAKKARAIVAD